MTYYNPSYQERYNCQKGKNCNYGICDECQLIINKNKEREDNNDSKQY